MIIFFTNSQPWWAGPLVSLILMSMGGPLWEWLISLASTPVALIGMLLWPGQDKLNAMRVFGAAASVAAIIGVMARLGVWARQRWQHFGTEHHRQQRQQQAARPPPAPRATVEAVAEALQRLPVELHASREDLQGMTVHALKERLRQRGVDCNAFIEKRELINRILDDGGSSCSTCSICCEDYQSGDPLRVLKCGHRLHLECIDQWFLQAAINYSRHPACPLCNERLIQIS